MPFHVPDALDDANRLLHSHSAAMAGIDENNEVVLRAATAGQVVIALVNQDRSVGLRALDEAGTHAMGRRSVTLMSMRLGRTR